MSTCSTATSTHRSNQSRRCRPPTSSEAVRGNLEMRLQDLERDWDAYKTGRSGAARHRRSRSASSLPSSAVTVAEPDGFHTSLPRRSPRRLVSSLQQTGSADAPAPSGPRDEDASSVCSAEGGGYSVATCSPTSCSCPSQCAVLCCGHSSSSSCTSTTLASFSLEVGGINGGRARKMDERKWSASRVVWISVIALVVVGFVVSMVVLELGVDEGFVEYQVPT